MGEGYRKIILLEGYIKSHKCIYSFFLSRQRSGTYEWRKRAYINGSLICVCVVVFVYAFADSCSGKRV